MQDQAVDAAATEDDQVLSTDLSKLSVELSAIEARSVERHQELLAHIAAAVGPSATSSSATLPPGPNSNLLESTSTTELASGTTHPALTVQSATPPSKPATAIAVWPSTLPPNQDRVSAPSLHLLSNRNVSVSAFLAQMLLWPTLAIRLTEPLCRFMCS